jgi:signal transduction histidine kinase
MIYCDQEQIRLVLMNLMANARDAMPSGGMVFLATTARDVSPDGDGLAPGSPHAPALDPGPYVMITLGDTGIGMDAATRARIFEPFFTTKTSGNHSGMGLAAAFGIVKQSGGDITVESQPGHGAQFRIWLPCAPVAHAEPKGPKAQQGMRTGE